MTRFRELELIAKYRVLTGLRNKINSEIRFLEDVFREFGIDPEKATR